MQNDTQTHGQRTSSPCWVAPPTEKQQRFAQAIAIRLRLNLPGWSKDQYSRFISVHIDDFYAKEPERPKCRQAVSYDRLNDIPDRDVPPSHYTWPRPSDFHDTGLYDPDGDSDVHIGPP